MDQVIIYNPRSGAEINDIFAQNKYRHEVNAIKRYDRQMADYLLKKYGFLVKVRPEKLNEIKKLMAAVYECDYEGCDYVTDEKKKLHMHKMGKHKITEEKLKEIEDIPEAKPVGKAEVLTINKKSPEQMEGIPDTKKGEVDGWYGPGWEADKISSGMMRPKRPGVTTGHFSAS